MSSDQNDEVPTVDWITRGGRTVHVYRDKAGQHRWRLRAVNGEIVASGEAYTRMYDAISGAYDLFPEAEMEEPG